MILIHGFNQRWETPFYQAAFNWHHRPHEQSFIYRHQTFQFQHHQWSITLQQIHIELLIEASVGRAAQIATAADLIPTQVIAIARIPKHQ